MVTVRESYFGVRNLVPAKPPRSQAAARIRRGADAAFRIGQSAAVCCFILAGVHTLLSAEPLASRVLSVIFIGALPAFLAHLGGHLAFRALVVASDLHDPVARELRRIASAVDVAAGVLHDDYGRPFAEHLQRWLLPRIRIARRHARLAVRRRIRQGLPPRRVVIRMATCPVRLLAHGLLWLQSAAATQRPA